MNPAADRVSRFIVMDDGRGGRCFAAVTTAGTAIPFSIDTCVSGRAPSEDQEARSAARTVVVDQILDFRDRALLKSPACALCFDPLTAETRHVDHRPPFTFARLWELFKQAKPELDFAAINAETLPGIRKFRDQRTAFEWAIFHRAHARLRILCVKDNLSASRREAAAR